MATDTEFTVNAGWTAASRITAVGATAVLMRNPTRVPVFFMITTSDTVPTEAVAQAHILPAYTVRDASESQFGLSLADAERLWLATEDDVINITLTTGPA